MPRCDVPERANGLSSISIFDVETRKNSIGTTLISVASLCLPEGTYRDNIL